MKTVQLISLTPEQLKESILEGFKLQIEELKKSLEPKKPTDYLTRQDVANMLQIDLSTLWSWTKKDVLTSYQISGRVYYKREEVEAAIQKLKS